MTKENKSAKSLVPVANSSEMAYYLDTHKFEHAMRVANMLAKANMVPVAYRNSPADCLIAFNSAVRMGLDPLQFMQKTYVVHGKIGIESQLAIALMNKSKLFTDVIQYKYSGKGDSRECRAFAFTVASGAECYEVCSVAQAKQMGWWTKKDSPWPKQTDKMLAYRSAINLIRKYHPEVLFGMDIAEDLKDFTPKDITPEVNQATNYNAPTEKTKAPDFNYTPLKEKLDKVGPADAKEEKLPKSQTGAAKEKKPGTPPPTGIKNPEVGEYVGRLIAMNKDPHTEPILLDIFALHHIPVTQEKINTAIKNNDEAHAKALIGLIDSHVG
jgi:hypothetical protein